MLKAARRLTKRAFRQRERAFLAEGPQAVAEALATGARVTGLFVTAPAQARHADLVAKRPRRRHRRPGGQRRGHERARADRHSAGHARGLRLRRRAARPGRRGQPPRLVALLANVRDPGNAGTVLRTADAAGADAVVFADASVDPYNGKCVRASAGSLFHLPVVAGTRLAEAVAALQGSRPAGRRGRRPGGHDPGRPADAGGARHPDRMAVRQRGMGATARPARPRRRVRGRADLRPGGEPEPGRRGGGVPVRVRGGAARGRRCHQRRIR